MQCRTMKYNASQIQQNTIQCITVVYNLVLSAKVIYTSSRNRANISHDIYHFVCHPYYLRSVTDHNTFVFKYIFIFPYLNFIIFILHGCFFVVVFTNKFTAFNNIFCIILMLYILLLNHSFIVLLAS